jgi:hypothetical protein
MGATPEELKADIDRTRAELVADVDALAEKAHTLSPAHVANRRPVAAGAVVFGAGILTGTLLRSRRKKRRHAAR